MTTPPVANLAPYLTDRQHALDTLRDRGIDPYPQSFPGRQINSKLREASTVLDRGGRLVGPAARAAGRLVAMRNMGRIAFLDLRDRSGTLQIVLDARTMGQDSFDLIQNYQRGDHLGATGHIMRTRSGEASLEALELVMLSKTLIPTDDGLRDPDLRQRHREADLISNPDARDRFVKRAAIIREIRDYMHENDFIEVETPTLQPLYGGAEARPFMTHHNALDMPMYLRIAPELYLKRCIAGDLERVFEIGKNFRNEGISTRHNPEFTVIEWYEAYADYIDTAREVEELVYRIALSIDHPRGDTFAPPWPRVRLHEAILEQTGVDILEHPTAVELVAAAQDAGIELTPDASWADLVDHLQSKFVEPTFDRPTFLVDHPVAISPLAKTHRADPRLTERFEAFAGGMEIANAFTELNDPIEQRNRFLALSQQGSDDHPLDEDFLMALGRGMPPTAGCGVGLDRLMMLMTESASIRDVILFPALRPRAEEAD